MGSALYRPDKHSELRKALGRPAPATKTVSWRNEWAQVTEEEKNPYAFCRITGSTKVPPGPLH